MPSDYCTVQEVKDMLPDVDWDVSHYDAILGSLITRASRLIDTFTNREPSSYIAPVTTREFDGNDRAQLFIGDLAADPTEVWVKCDGINYTLLDKSDYYCVPINALLEYQPYHYIRLENAYFPCWRKAVKVKGNFGYSITVPDDIKQAAIIQVVRWFKHGQQAFQNNAANNELGAPQYGGLDDSVTSILASYRRFVI